MTSGDEADETGIIVAGKDHNGHGYVLADQKGSNDHIYIIFMFFPERKTSS